MTTTHTTRLITADIIRTKREALRIRFLNFFAIDKTMRAGDDPSPFEVAQRREALLRADEAIRAQVMSQPRYLIK